MSLWWSLYTGMTHFHSSMRMGGSEGWVWKLPHFVDNNRRGDIKLLRETEN